MKSGTLRIPIGDTSYLSVSYSCNALSIEGHMELKILLTGISLMDEYGNIIKELNEGTLPKWIYNQYRAKIERDLLKDETYLPWVFKYQAI